MKSKPTPSRRNRQTAPKKPVAAVVVRQTSHEKYTVAQVIQALQFSRGMIAAAARTLGCVRETVYEYMKRYPEIGQALKEAEELQLDTTELKLFQAIDQGQAWSICFYLKTKGRHRGYVEKHEVAPSDLTLEMLVGMLKQKTQPPPKDIKVING